MNSNSITKQNIYVPRKSIRRGGFYKLFTLLFIFILSAQNFVNAQNLIIENYTICPGETIVLTNATANALRYEWNDGLEGYYTQSMTVSL